MKDHGICLNVPVELSSIVPGDASGLDLSALPVTGALSNSYLIEFLTSGATSAHTVEVTIKENNADGKRTYPRYHLLNNSKFQVNFYNLCFPLQPGNRGFLF